MSKPVLLCHSLLKPQIHLGAAVVAMMKKGMETRKSEIYNSIEKTNNLLKNTENVKTVSTVEADKPLLNSTPRAEAEKLSPRPLAKKKKKSPSWFDRQEPMVREVCNYLCQIFKTNRAKQYKDSNYEVEILKDESDFVINLNCLIKDDRIMEANYQEGKWHPSYTSNSGVSELEVNYFKQVKDNLKAVSEKKEPSLLDQQQSFSLLEETKKQPQPAERERKQKKKKGLDFEL